VPEPTVLEPDPPWTPDNFGVEVEYFRDRVAKDKLEKRDLQMRFYLEQVTSPESQYARLYRVHGADLDGIWYGRPGCARRSSACSAGTRATIGNG
jgi:hypothetical protein